MAHVRKGDLVVVTKGKDKGKRGKVLRVVVAKAGSPCCAAVPLSRPPRRSGRFYSPSMPRAGIVPIRPVVASTGFLDALAI